MECYAFLSTSLYLSKLRDKMEATAVKQRLNETKKKKVRGENVSNMF